MRDQAPHKRSKRRRATYALLLALIGICFLPVLSVNRATQLAQKHGCTLHEGFVNPCVVDGVDIGPRLYDGFASGWFFMLTGPIALIAAAALLGMAARDLIYFRRHRR